MKAPRRTGAGTPRALLARARRIRCLFLDIDGVLTDGKLYIGPNGEETKTNFVRDGLGIKLLLKAGLQVAVISGRPSPSMRQRLEYLGITEIVLDNEDKLPAFEQIRDKLGLKDEQCAVMGDDLPDVPVMQRAALALAPADAHPVARRLAHYVARATGGHGAVREACDLILQAQDK